MAELIAAMKAVDDIPKVAVLLDGCTYSLDWPEHWDIHHSNDHLEMSGAIDVLFHYYPDEQFYGMLDDHTRPISKWSRKLMETAGRFQIASAWNTVNRIKNGRQRLNNYAIGGGLARVLGWVWPTNVVHLYGDDILEDIGYELGILKFVEEAKFQPYLLRDGTLKADGNSLRKWKGEHYGQRDAQSYVSWRRHEFGPLVTRLKGLGYCAK